jgi:hypothetical protein
MTSNNKQQITENRIIYQIFFFLFFVICSLLFVPKTNAAVSYPIEELGNCRNARECALYCSIPKNTPACWSYDKYVLNGNTLSTGRQVLGEETVNITYPISELGHCQDAQSCFLFCAKAENQEACVNFGKKQGLVKEETEETPPPAEVIEAAKTELGCEGKESCMAICNKPENMEKCMQFGQKHGLAKPPKGPPPNVMKNAKKELGCDSEVSCMNVCNMPENMDKCFQFAKKHQLMEEEEVKKFEMSQEQYQEKKQAMIEKAKEELGCSDFESCGNFCSKTENMEKCANLGKKFGMGPMQPQGQNLPPISGQPQPSSTMKGPGGCTSEKECIEYCQKHPNDCPGFSNPSMQSSTQNISSPPISGAPNMKDKPNLLSPPPQMMQKQSNASKEGNFLGPGGCKTEGECKAYCEKHPNDCPGFPQSGKMDLKTTPMSISNPSNINPFGQGENKNQQPQNLHNPNNQQMNQGGSRQEVPSNPPPTNP